MSVEHISINGRELTAFDLPPKGEDYEVHLEGDSPVVERVPSYDELAEWVKALKAEAYDLKRKADSSSRTARHLLHELAAARDLLRDYYVYTELVQLAQPVGYVTPTVAAHGRGSLDSASLGMRARKILGIGEDE